ncbi:MAG: hypothetical protein HY438_01375 [DPANN group archaeon]|nr:hypothetical protein [DPANN group archaeon]
MSKKLKDLEATLNETDLAKLLDAMDEARQLIYLRNMAAVSRALLLGLGHATGKAAAEGFFGVTVDWFDERAKAGDYTPLVLELQKYKRFPGVADTLKDLYVAFPVLMPEQSARQAAQTPLSGGAPSA